MTQSLPVALIDQIVRQQERITELETALKWAAMHLDERFLSAIGCDNENPVTRALKSIPLSAMPNEKS